MNGKLRPKNFACSLKYRNYDKEINQQGNKKCNPVQYNHGSTDKYLICYR